MVVVRRCHCTVTVTQGHGENRPRPGNTDEGWDPSVQHRGSVSPHVLRSTLRYYAVKPLGKATVWAGAECRCSGRLQLTQASPGLEQYSVRKRLITFACLALRTYPHTKILCSLPDHHPSILTSAQLLLDGHWLLLRISGISSFSGLQHGGYLRPSKQALPIFHPVLLMFHSLLSCE